MTIQLMEAGAAGSVNVCRIYARKLNSQSALTAAALRAKCVAKLPSICFSQWTALFEGGDFCPGLSQIGLTI